MRKFYLAAMLLMPFLFLCGCSKDTVSGKPEDLIIGTWGLAYTKEKQVDADPSDGQDHSSPEMETYYDVSDPNISVYKFDEYGIVYVREGADDVFRPQGTYKIIGDSMIADGDTEIAISFKNNNYFEMYFQEIDTYGGWIYVATYGLQRLTNIE